MGSNSKLGDNFALAQPGSPGAESGAFGGDRPLVNFIWITPSKVVPKPDGPLCGVGLQYIERAVDNANKYPQADFRLWIDRKLLDDSTHFWLGSFVHLHTQGGNIALCDLRDIPAYESDPVFTPQYGFAGRAGSGNVYSRADYARVLVLEHCLHHCAGRSRIIYADIDCKDVRLSEAIPIIDEYGLVMNDTGGDCISHGYLGLAAGNDKIRMHFGAWKDDTRKAARRNELGFSPFEMFLNRIDLPHWKYGSVIGLPGLLPRSGQTIGPHQLARDLGIN